MRTVLERPKSQVAPHGEARAGAPRAPHGATAAPKEHPETPKISKTKNDANLCNKKGINMTAKVMHEKRPGETPSKHEKSCWRLHGSTICTCCIAQEKTEKGCHFAPKGNAHRPQKPQKKRGNGKKFSTGS